jgi:hypothetical protein
MLDVACNRCDRRGRPRMDRLLTEHGPAMPMPELRLVIAANCPRMIAGQMHTSAECIFPAAGCALSPDGITPHFPSLTNILVIHQPLRYIVSDNKSRRAEWMISQ